MGWYPILAQITVAWFYSHLLEYFLHRFVLHNPRMLKGSWFRTHFAEHHNAARKLQMVDPLYWSLKKVLKHPEAKGLFLLSVLHLPIAFFFPWAAATLTLSAASYYLIHRRAHVDTQWGRSWLPWHYDHHMAPDQNVNWGVRLPLFDTLFGTKVLYKGTMKETSDILRETAKANGIRSRSNQRR